MEISKLTQIKIAQYGPKAIRTWGYVIKSKDNTVKTIVYPLLFGYCLVIIKINPKGFRNPSFVDFINNQVIKK